MKLHIVPAIAVILIFAACSGGPATNQGGNATAPSGNNAASSADDDTLKPAAPVVNEGQDHDESQPHTH